VNLFCYEFGTLCSLTGESWRFLKSLERIIAGSCYEIRTNKRQASQDRRTYWFFHRRDRSLLPRYRRRMHSAEYETHSAPPAKKYLVQKSLTLNRARGVSHTGEAPGINTLKPCNGTTSPFALARSGILSVPIFEQSPHWERLRFIHHVGEDLPLAVRGLTRLEGSRCIGN